MADACTDDPQSTSNELWMSAQLVSSLFYTV